MEPYFKTVKTSGVLLNFGYLSRNGERSLCCRFKIHANFFWDREKLMRDAEAVDRSLVLIKRLPVDQFSSYSSALINRDRSESWPG
jgi:hypothetical protein